MCDKTSALAALNILGDAINDLMNHSETKLTLGDILRAQNDLYYFINRSSSQDNIDSQDVINALERQTKRMTSFLEENYRRAWGLTDQPSMPSSSEQTHGEEDEEKESTSQLNQLHTRNQ